MPFRWSALAAALAAALGLPGGATHAIIPQQGIAGVRLGMTQDAVSHQLGKPLRARTGQNQFGLWTAFDYPNLQVFFQGDVAATSVTTTSPDERTRGGAGVGSSEQQLRALVPGIVCRTEFGARHCFVGRFRAGRRVTDFLVSGGYVTSVTVGLVID